MSRNKWSLDRERFIHEETDRLNAKIERAQSKLFKLLNASLLTWLPVDDKDNLTPDNNIMFLSSKLDNLFDDFQKEHIEPIIGHVSKSFDKLIDKNDRYYQSIKLNEKAEPIKNSVLSTLGISIGTITAGSLLFNMLQNRDAINTIKNVVMGGMTGGMNITAFKIAVEEIVLKQDGGLLKKLFDFNLPDPYVKVDRFVGQKYSVELKLNYAIYQGGLIKTSRDFCIERNNKVFSRDEIMRFGSSEDKFGGYTNKAMGEFQGKPDNYNPLIDCGGFNCLHSWDWVSDELAFHLRPALKRLN